MIRRDGRYRAARAMTVAGAAALLAMAGCNRNDPPQPRSDAPPASAAPGPAGLAPGAPMAPDIPGAAGSTVGDAAVTARVKAALLADPLVSGMAIDVDTRDGVVSLAGKVSGAAERNRAVDIARNTDGVRSVTDGLSAPN
jgi:hyperosmotically inducible periplasmic protein